VASHHPNTQLLDVCHFQSPVSSNAEIFSGFFKRGDLIIIGPERMQNFVQPTDDWLLRSRLADSSCRLTHKIISKVLLEV